MMASSGYCIIDIIIDIVINRHHYVEKMQWTVSLVSGLFCVSNFADSSHNWDHQQLIINFVHPEFPITSLLWQDESCSSLNCLRHCYYLLLPTFWYNLKKKIQIQSYSGDEQKLGQRSGSPCGEYSYSTAKIFLVWQFNKHSFVLDVF